MGLAALESPLATVGGGIYGFTSSIGLLLTHKGWEEKESLHRTTATSEVPATDQGDLRFREFLAELQLLQEGHHHIWVSF